MATASFTWTNWDATNAWENLADAANSTSLTYARDATDVAAKFTIGTKGTTQTEFGRKSGAGDTWASIFGIGANDTVTQVQISAWTKKLVTATKLTSHSVTMGFIDDSAARITASDSITGVALGTTTDGSYVAQSAGSTVNVNAASQVGSTSVRFSLEYTVTTGTGGGSASVDQRFDGVTATITYMPFTGSSGTATPAGVHSTEKVGTAQEQGRGWEQVSGTSRGELVGVSTQGGRAQTFPRGSVGREAVGAATAAGQSVPKRGLAAPGGDHAAEKIGSSSAWGKAWIRVSATSRKLAVGALAAMGRASTKVSGLLRSEKVGTATATGGSVSQGGDNSYPDDRRMVVSAASMCKPVTAGMTWQKYHTKGH